MVEQPSLPMPDLHVHPIHSEDKEAMAAIVKKVPMAQLQCILIASLSCEIFYFCCLLAHLEIDLERKRQSYDCVKYIMFLKNTYVKKLTSVTVVTWFALGLVKKKTPHALPGGS